MPCLKNIGTMICRQEKEKLQTPPFNMNPGLHPILPQRKILPLPLLAIAILAAIAHVPSIIAFRLGGRHSFPADPATAASAAASLAPPLSRR